MPCNDDVQASSSSSQFNLDEEVICGHTVTSKTKKLWKVELDLAQQLARICDMHGIRYYCAGGTLLGAVRHKGFIPWDDDMDFFMMKEDYEAFCKIAPKELEEPYGFQKTFSLSRIRNSNTTGCTLFEAEHAIQPYNLGIFIDIFPLCAVPNDARKRRIHKRAISRMRMARYGQRSIELDAYHNKLRMRSWLRPSVLYWKLSTLFSKETLADQFLNLCDMYRGADADQVGITTFLPYVERYMWDRKWFEEDPVYLPFENISVTAPQHYDEVLRKSFGDYSVYDKNGAQHTMSFCEPDIPYLQNEQVLAVLADETHLER